MMQSNDTNALKAIDLQWLLTTTRFDEWLKNDLFHMGWWVLLTLFVLSACFWWKIVDKSRLNKIILFTALVTIMILVLDELGEEMTLWDYPIDIIPIFPPLSAIDLACLPMVYSLMYQYFNTWKSFLIASFVMSAISCFILEPVFVWTGVYQMLTWKSYYGFPIYAAIGICSKAFVEKVSLHTSR